MATRHRQSPRKDKRYFTRTAARAKKINVNPTIFRGGIRL